MWKAIHEGLPTFNTLAQRHITNINSCPQCNNVPETTSHVLFQCIVASQVWQLIISQRTQNNHINPANQASNSEKQIPNSIQTTIGSNIPHSTKTLYGFRKWNLWLVRNQEVCQQQRQTPTQTTQIIQVMFKEYNWAQMHLLPILPNLPQCNQQSAHRETTTIMIVWEAPTDEWIKINTDRATKGCMGPEGAGVICRNNNGKILMEMAAPLGIITSTTAETRGLLLATRITVQQQ